MRNRIVTLLKIAVGAVLVVLILRRIEAPEEVLALLGNIGIWQFAAAVLLFQTAVFLNALRWHAVLARIGAKPELTVSVVSTFEGMLFNLFFPGGFGGDAMRVYRVYDWGARGADAIGAGLIDRALGLWGLAAAVLIATPFIGAFEAAVPLRVILIAAATIVAGGLLAGVAARGVAALPLPGWAAPVRGLVLQYGRVVLSAVFLTRILPALVVANLAACASMWFATRSVGLAVSFAEGALVIEMASFASAIPVTVGGWGLREGAIILLLEATGAANASAVAAAAVVGLTMLASGLIGGAVWVAVPYAGRRGLFRPRRAAAVEKESGE